jgi:signal transduction histidine kinase
VRISGEFTEGALRLTVTDDGCGFIPSDAQGAADGHFGLDGIRERLRRHGGEMHIESAPGGTSVFICMQTMENGHEKSIR